MTCEEFWSGEADSPEHLSECAACAARLARHQEVAAGLRALGAEMRRVEAPARVERALVTAFRSQNAIGGAPARGTWWLAGAWAAAVAAMALLAVVLVRPHDPAPHPARRTVRSMMQLAAVRDASADVDAADGFVPLPNTELPDANEETNVVRVEVPRSAMIPLGYAVPAERAAETVEADVMLDADGVARAIRFVETENNAKEVTW